MSTIVFSKIFIEQINTIIRRFWWAGIQEENPTNPITFRSWEDITKPTYQGGLGIIDMELINKSLIINSAWNIVTIKIPSSQPPSKPNTSQITVFGQPQLLEADQCIGLLFCKLNNNYMPTPLCRYTMVPLQFGPLPGQNIRVIFMII
jgi:hypothetical protein